MALGGCGEVQERIFSSKRQREDSRNLNPISPKCDFSILLITSAESESPCSPSSKHKNTYQPTRSSSYRERP